MKKLLRITLKILSALILLLIIAVGFLLVRPTTINFAWLHEPIDRQLTGLLGHEVNINGDIVLVTGMSPKIRVENLSVENPKGWEGGGQFAELETFVTQISLHELINKQVKVDDIEIRGLALKLEVDADGRGNWQRHASGVLKDVVEENSDEAAVEFLGLGSIEISDISVTWLEAGKTVEKVLIIDRVSGSAPEGEAMQLTILGKARELKLDGVFKAGTLEQLFTGAAEWPWSFDGTVGASTLMVNSQVAATGGKVSGITTFELKIPDSRELHSITGPIPHFGSILLGGEVTRTEDGLYSLPALKGNLGESPVNAKINVDLSRVIPKITGEIEIAFLDIEALKVQTDGSAEPETDRKEITQSDPPASAEKNSKPVLPVAGTFELRIGEITNTSSTIRDLSLALEVGEHFATANVGVEFAGTSLLGKLDLNNEEGSQTDLVLELEGKGADLKELIRHYSGNDHFSGGFERLHYKVTGSGPSSIEAWGRRSVSLEIDQATMIYHGNGKDWKFTVDKARSDRRPGEDGSFVANGQLGGAPWELDITSREWSSGEKLKLETISGKVADLEFNLEPLESDSQSDGDAGALKFSLKGGRLDKLNPIYELDLPPLGPYALTGEIRTLDEGIALEEFMLKLGQSKITGGLKLNKKGDIPVIDLNLKADVIQLNDFKFDDWSSVEGKKTAEAPILSYQTLSKLDATIDLAVGKMLSGKDSLGAAKAKMSLKGGRFELKQLTASPLGGKLNVSVLFHPKKNGKLDWRASLKAVKLDFGVLARNFNPKSKNGGMINIDLLLESKNVPFGKLQMEAATGRLNFDFCPTNLNAGIVDLWATNILVALLPKLDSENQSVINCVIARLKLKNGVIHAETLGLDTTKIRVGTEGTINLKDKSIDLTLTPVPKKAQILSLEVPISIRGTLKKPEISIGSLPMVETVGRITKNTVLFPIKRIVSKELPADGSDICPCKKEFVPPKEPTEGDLRK
jgi:uncharacterized protein involved in outer membrane biogenesis